ncbi:MAG: hypothetical protein COA57_04635 [Flavobacteriales bacterium]|nr:MAG: hypothetical protein COA57_04635 [Flavobacteriales bacterium]
MIFSLILVFRSDVTLICFQKTLSYALLFLIVPAYLIKLISEKGEEVIKWINYFGLFILLVGLAFYLLGQDIAFLGGRYRGILGNPNGLGIFSTLLLLFFEISRNKFPKLFSKKEMWLIYTVLLLSLVLSQARTSLFTVLIFLFFNYLYKYSAFLGFLIFLMSIFIYQIVLNNIIEIILFLNLEEYFRIETIDEGSGRYVAWDFAWENIQKNFFIGKGFVFADDLFHKNYVPLSKMGHQGGVHNSYLNFWLDTGLVGLILYFVGFFMLFIKAAKRNKAALPIMYAVLFSITFESWLNSSLNSFTIIFVMIVTLLFQDNESVSKESHLPIH